jgi:hypothetical protein
MFQGQGRYRRSDRYIQGRHRRSNLLHCSGSRSVPQVRPVILFPGQGRHRRSDRLHVSTLIILEFHLCKTLFYHNSRVQNFIRCLTFGTDNYRRMFQVKVGTAGQTGYIVSRSRSARQVRPVILFPGQDRHRRSDRLHVSTSIFLEFHLCKTLFYHNIESKISSAV